MAVMRALIASSTRAGSSIRNAASPAGSMRKSIIGYSGTAGQGVQELLVDIVEPAVRHDDDEVTLLRLTRDGADDLVGLRDVARIDARVRQVA